MNQEQLQQTAEALVATGKGILAADESNATAGKRLASIGMENTEAHRRAMRDMLFGAKGLSDYISGVILFDETLRQDNLAGTSFAADMQAHGVIPGIKVDEGLENINDVEQVTKGLENLAGRLPEYYDLGARFAKWRAVFAITDTYPSVECYEEAASRLAKYAKICQENNIVPIVEPEVMMDGQYNTHSLERSREVVTAAHKALFAALEKEGAYLPGVLLKPSMAIPGNGAESATVEAVAQATVDCLKETVPADVAGVVFLSGGQSDEEATAHLDAMNKIAAGSLPWTLTYSYGRALQAASLQAWGGKPENVAAGRAAILHRAKMNSLASKGQYSSSMEAEAAA